MDSVKTVILHVALDTPLRQIFDYLPPAVDAANGDGSPDGSPLPGTRVLVPFGRRRLIGILVAIGAASRLPAAKLKPAITYLDAAPLFDPATLALLTWAADYYHHPIGEVFAAALPAGLRTGQAALDTAVFWHITPAGRAELDAPHPQRARQQHKLLTRLAEFGDASADELHATFKPAILRALAKRECVAPDRRRVAPIATSVTAAVSPIDMTAAQADSVARIIQSLGGFAPHLLYGVTGSGKTEVYLRVIAAVVAAGGQALVLVPEIALTPQLVTRFQQRFAAGVAAVHSGLTDTERRTAWRDAYAGSARIIIGTRSAVFTSMPELRLIVVDEEHDASYKQHEGFRYSARDLAVMRAREAGVPVILGSATPSLETLENAAAGRYAKHLLPQRPGTAQQPRMTLIDLRRHAIEQGLSGPALQAIGAHLNAGGQVIVFLNRRGYAPTLFCSACGWVAPCAHCDARMTLHRGAAELRCHHCGAHAPVPVICGECGQPLRPVGQGTERVEETLQRFFPAVDIARLDRDTAGARGAIQGVLERVHSGAARILVGTQMLTKGHHFPEVSLVVVLDADQGLFATDYRATERLAQTITQVAGRAGREARSGEVLIQTLFPEHPLLTRLIDSGYDAFAAAALEERRAAEWPPFSRLALLRAEAKDRAGLNAFLRAAVGAGVPFGQEVKMLGPAAALLARRADHFRAHVLLEAATRAPLQRFLHRWLPRVEALRGPTGLRWSLDVDPIEVD